MNDEIDLLRQYAEQGDESAFTELVRRKINLVHSAALRQVGGDPHLAQEVTQAVFLDLARKASSVTAHTALAGWLFTSTRFAATKAIRAQQRWKHRTHEAEAMSEIQQVGEQEPTWTQLRPVLDLALSELNQCDRDALLLRFFEERSFAEVGATIGLSENSARMRVERALDKLRTGLARRGITSTAAALALLLSQQAVVAAPDGLDSTVAEAVLTGAGATGGISAAGGILGLTKVQGIVAGCTAALGLVTIGVQFVLHLQLRSENADLRDQIRAANSPPIVSTDGAVVQVPAPAPTPAAAAARGGARRAGGGARGAVPALSDPNVARLARITQGGLIDLRYTALFRNLGLSSPQTDQLKELMLDREYAASGVAPPVAVASAAGAPSNLVAAANRSSAEIENSIRQLLGPSGYLEFQRYQTTLPQRALANQLSDRLRYTSTPLTIQQTERLLAVMAGPATAGPGGVPALPLNGNALIYGPPAQVTDADIVQAQSILSVQQLAVLRQIQTEQQASQDMAARISNLARGQPPRSAGP